MSGADAIAAITFVGGLVGSVLLVADADPRIRLHHPWLLLLGLVVMLFGKQRVRAGCIERVTIGRPTLVAAQSLLAIYGGYFGGGVGLMMTATYGLLAGAHPRSLFAVRTLMLAIANFAAALVFVSVGLVRWAACVPMLLGAIVGGWLGAKLGKRLSPRLVRIWTLLVTAGDHARLLRPRLRLNIGRLIANAAPSVAMRRPC